MESEYKCEYPGCKKPQDHRLNLRLTNEAESSVDLPFCEYHYYIVVGGHFSAEVIKIPAIEPTEKEPEGTPARMEFKLLGPLKEVEIAEQVFGAIQIAKELKEKREKEDLNN